MERECWWDTAFSSSGTLLFPISLSICDQDNLQAVINHKNIFYKGEMETSGDVCSIRIWPKHCILVVLTCYLSFAYMCMMCLAAFTSPAQCPLHARTVSFLADHSPELSWPFSSTDLGWQQRHDVVVRYFWSCSFAMPLP